MLFEPVIHGIDLFVEVKIKQIAVIGVEDSTRVKFIDFDHNDLASAVGSLHFYCELVGSADFLEFYSFSGH